ncbi:MAG: hypothetical protein KDK11_08860 [Maritimibacter sp.]|nr:hypothetical protein [Maritimibacter sp.]
MHKLVRYRRHRFAALHALLTGSTRPGHDTVPPVLRRDVGLPEVPETRPGPPFDPMLGLARPRD